jgi:ligand-binding SRPBCC domain-containing protein
MRTFRITTDIAAPTERVWQCDERHGTMARMDTSVTSVKRLDSSGPLAIGIGP